MLFEQFLVSVRNVKLPRNYARGVTPSGRNTGNTVLASARNNTHYSTVFVLLDGNVSKPFGEEFLGIVVYGCGAAKHLRIPRPTHTLVTLRTVGWNVKEVALLTPYDVMIKLVYLFVSAYKTTCALYIRMNTNCLKILFVNEMFGTFNEMNVAESLEGVGGFKYVVISRKNVYIFILCRSHIAVVEVAILVKHLTVMQNDTLAALTLNSYFNVSRHILTEINNVFAFWSFDYINCVKLVYFLNPLTVLRHKGGIKVSFEGSTETLYLGGKVNRFTVVNVGRGYVGCEHLEA